MVLQLPLQPDAFADVPDIALDDVVIAFPVDVADELDFGLFAGLALEGKVLVADVAVLLKFFVDRLTRLLVGKQTDFPQLLVQKLVVRVP
jgi:hypothetical protein